MTQYKIISTDIFEQELQNIYYYICFYLKEPIIAARICNQVRSSLSKLNHFPEGYSKLENSKNNNLSRLIIKNYIIVYEVNRIKKEVYVLHIFHNTQNYLNLL